MSDVVVRTEGVCGRITLNRPKAMNALNVEMVRVFYAALTQWARDPMVEFILVDGAGDRGLCAGGDIRALYSFAVDRNASAAETFFREEYRLNYLIARYPKPYVVLMDGIVMGGGIGISSHGNHRVVTERSTLAMPETSIGFIPDVGGTYLLGTAPGEFGTYMALTGSRIGAGDAILCGLADSYVPANQLALFAEELARCAGSSAMQSCLQSFAAEPPPATLETQREWINDCFAPDTVEDIVLSLRARSESEALAAAAEISKNSPTALKVTLRALRNGRRYRGLEACLEQEYSVALHSMRAGDFVEGVRAAVIDKDRRPAWRPASLEEVSAEQVDSFFAEAQLLHLDLSN